MNITRAMDSFDVLQVKEDATVGEIKESLIYHVEMFCGEDGSKKNRDGDYLAEIYHEHYKRLMNPEEKAKLIEERKFRETNLGAEHNPYENALVPKTLEEKENCIITSMNKEVIERYSKMEPKTSFSLKKVPLKNTYVIVGQDCSLIFANSVYQLWHDIKTIDSKTGKIFEEKSADFYNLKDCFFKRYLFYTNGDRGYPYFALPWANEQIFKVNGVLSVAFLASKIFPNSLVYNGKIKDRDFRQVYEIIYKYLKENSDYVANLFEDVDEEEVNKRMLLTYNKC